jgi:hypothetical protein
MPRITKSTKTASKKATKRGAKVTQEKKVSAKAKEPKPLEKCRCGCGVEGAGTYRMGHDARFHGRVKKLLDGRLSMAHLEKELGHAGEYALAFYRTELD